VRSTSGAAGKTGPGQAGARARRPGPVLPTNVNTNNKILVTIGYGIYRLSRHRRPSLLAKAEEIGGRGGDGGGGGGGGGF